MKIHLNYLADNACLWHRFLLPARYCGPDFANLGHTITVGDGIPKDTEWVGLHGLPNDVGVYELARAKRRGQRILWSLDDDWTSIPDWNPAKPTEDGLTIYEMLKSMADLILVSTPALANTFADVKHKIVYGPNLTEISAYPEVKAKKGPDGNNQYDFAIQLPLKICWSGGKTHKGDVDILTPVLSRLLAKYAERQILVVFAGMMPPPDLLRDYLHKGLMHQPGVNFPLYQGVVNSMMPDIWLAPMAKIPFNLSKSNLRVMEGWALRSAVVATDWGEYGCIEGGTDGRLADSEEEWYSALSRLIVDHEYRLTMAMTGRERVEKEYNWHRWECRRQWHEVFARIFECDLPPRRE